MKNRKVCQAALSVVIIVCLLYHLGGSRVFPILKNAEEEMQLSDGLHVKLGGEIYKKVWKEDSWILYLRNIKIQGMKESNYSAGVKLLVYLSKQYEGEIPEYGRWILISGTITFFQEAPNPGNFNQRFYYQKQDICGAVREALVECVYEPSGDPGGIKHIFERMSQVRQKAAAQIIEYLGMEKGGILCAMLLGESSMADGDVKELYQKSGIGHLLAISGLHVSFVGMGIYELLRRFAVRRSAAAAISSLTLILYAAMAGGGVSIIRAVTMFLLRMGAEVTGREYDGLTALAVAMFVVLGRNPLLLFDAGFLLSFGAVFGIYVILPAWISETDKERMKLLKISFAVQTTILPVMLYYYYEMSVYTIVWNLIAVPLTGVVLGSGFAGVVSGFILPESGMWITKLLYGICGLILEFYKRGSEGILRLPRARWIPGKPGVIKILAYYFFIFLTVILLKKEKRKPAVAGIVSAILMLGIPIGIRGQLEIVMLNVGQGDCFFIRGPKGCTYLIDGGSSTVGEVGKYRIEPFLKSEGVGKLDYVWISHGDIDHMSGISEMLQRQEKGIRIERILMPEKAFWDEKLYELAEIAEENDTETITVKPGRILKEGELSILCLWPEINKTEAVQESGNEASMVLALQYKEFDMLFTGDLENEAEEKVGERVVKLQKSGMLPDGFEVLKAGHHGSRNATSDYFLEVTKPDTVWVSAGEKNRYGHPHEEVLERLANWHVSLYNTKDGHAVKLYTDGEKYSILRP